jgi:hypothetical protein
MILRVSCIAAVLACAAPAAAAGLSVELGPGLAGRTFVGEVALNAQISHQSGSAIEIGARGYIAPPGLTFSPFAGATLGVRYRTVPLTSFFTLAFGSGVMFWMDCLRGDSCGGFGPVFDASPTLELKVSSTVRLFAALNVRFGVILVGNLVPWAAGTLSLGAAFDFGPNRKDTVSS